MIAMKFDYYMPSRLLFGAGKLQELHKHKLPGTKALIVMTGGKSLRANGSLAALEEELRLAGASAILYDKITPNPAKTQIMEGARVAKSNGCDFVIGFGGGSSNGSRAEASFIGKDPPGNPITQCTGNDRSPNSAGHGLGGEGHGENLC